MKSPVTKNEYLTWADGPITNSNNNFCCFLIVFIALHRIALSFGLYFIFAFLLTYSILLICILRTIFIIIMTCFHLVLVLLIFLVLFSFLSHSFLGFVLVLLLYLSYLSNWIFLKLIVLFCPCTTLFLSSLVLFSIAYGLNIYPACTEKYYS